MSVLFRYLLVMTSLVFMSQCQSPKVRDVEKPNNVKGGGSKENQETQLNQDVPTLKKNIISLGFNCGVRYNLQNKYFFVDKIETNFFDWAFSDFRSVLTILNLEKARADEFFSVENIELLDSFPAIYGGKFKGLPGVRFIHDIQKNKDINREKAAFSSRYHRRYERFIEAIKTKETIYFVRWNEEPALTEVDQFFASLEKLKANHKHVLVNVLVKAPTLNISKKSWKGSFKSFNLNDYPFVEMPAEDGGGASQNHLDWKKVFDWIDAHPGRSEPWTPGAPPSLHLFQEHQPGCR